MKDTNLLKDLILKKIDLGSLLLDYGVHFTYDPTQIDEVQFQCPFHGVDRKPSARYYRTTQSCYCWYCKKRWDAISFVMDKERMHFVDAMKLIIKKYSIDISSIPDEPNIRTKKTSISMQGINLKKSEINVKNLRGKIPLIKYKALVSALYMISWQASKGVDVVGSLRKLEEKIRGLV